MVLHEIKLGVVGATGEVGRTMLKVLEERGHDFPALRVFSSKRSAGSTLTFNGKKLKVEELTEKSMKEGFDFLLFSAGKSVSKKFAPIAAEHGTTVIDNSSAFRMEKDIPLVVPEINSHAIKDYQGIIANPNCSTIQMVLILNPLHIAFGLNRVVVTTMQAVSGSGHKGVVELRKQISDEEYAPQVYPKRIAYNCIPHIGEFLSNGFSEEEMKMINETQKIMECDCDVEATTVRVPVMYGHSESVYVEFKKEASLQEVEKVLAQAPAVKVWKDYPTALDVKGSDESHVGRLRMSHDGKGILFWNVADNVRVGAATNAVKILEKLL
nr:aspartate-semialdehyde dehydrogenase [Mesoaciditoga lauensis]